MNTFESRLESELVRMVSQRAATPEPAAAPQPAWRRPRVRLAAVAAITAAAFATPLILSGSGGQPAYAVVRNPDGTITATVHDLRNPDGLQQKLRDFGIHATVTVNEVCGARGSANRYLDPPPGGPEVKGHLVTIDPRRLPADATLYLAVRKPSGTRPADGFSVRLVRSGTPVSCTPSGR